VAHTQPVTLSGQVFSCNSRVRSGFFLDSGENFGPPDPFTHCIVGSSFFRWVGSGLSSRSAHDQVYVVSKYYMLYQNICRCWFFLLTSIIRLIQKIIGSM
jgi:hypothetical protein